MKATSKPNFFKALKATTNNLFLSANDQKLRFYQNKELSYDRHCGVSNTFPTRNQTSESKNQDFHHPFRLGKTDYFLT